MDAITYRRMTEAELAKLRDIDRSETIRVGYELRDGHLFQMSVDWDAPDFFREGDGEHTVAHQIAFCRGHLEAKATMIGAFDSEKLVGVGLLTPEVRPKMAQLSYLQVSSAFRRRGIGTAIVGRLLQRAREEDAKWVYVSATPSQSAVEFYENFGFTPVAEPLPELYALEPHDIHMIMELGASAGGGSA